MYDERDGNSLKNKPSIDMNIVYKNAPKFFLLGSLVAVIIVMTLLNSRFLTLGNIINISRHMSINMIIAVGMTFCLISAGMDLSVGSVLALSAIIGALALKSGVNIFFSIIILFNSIIVIQNVEILHL